MAGSAADRELTRAGGLRFATATRADDAAIRRLLRDNPMEGAIKLSFEREPDYFLGTDLAGGKDQTIVAWEGEKLVCLGRCSHRPCWIDGHATSAGYLAELRLDHAARNRFGILRAGYRFFHGTAGADSPALYFTSIASDNERALRLLERGAKGLPQYGFLAELETVLIAVPRRPRRPKLPIRAGTTDDLVALIALLRAEGQRYQLATVWTEDTVRSLERHGLPLSQFYIAMVDGQLAACGGLWDQRGFRQTVIQSYSRALALARPMLNLASLCRGKPGLPFPGLPLAHASISPLAFAEEAEALLPDFIETFFPLAVQSGIEFLTLALPADDGRLEILRRRFTTRTWRSRLYRVDWPDEPRTGLDTGGKFLPDVGLL